MSYGATGFSPQDNTKGGVPEEVLMMSDERVKTVAAMCAAAAQAELPSSPDSPGKNMSDIDDYGGDDQDDLIMRLAEYEAEQEATKADAEAKKALAKQKAMEAEVVKLKNRIASSKPGTSGSQS